MSSTYFYYRGGVVVADGIAEAAAGFERFGASIASGEAMAVTVSAANEAAPIVAAYNDARFLENFRQAAIAQDWNVATRELFATTVGFLAGAAVVAAPPAAVVGLSGFVVTTAAAVAADMSASMLFTEAYNGARKYFSNPDIYYNNQTIHPVGKWLPPPGDPNWRPQIGRRNADPAIAITFNNFSKYPQRTDPFTLDLDNDGIETVGVNAVTPLLFDIDAVGIQKSVGWVKADDGLLVLDRNGNGTIDSGAELFGDATPVFDTAGNLVRQAADGFDALAQQDSNLDGVIDNLDTNWTNLRVWQDANQDGISQ